VRDDYVTSAQAIALQMPYTTQETQAAVVLTPRTPVESTIIWLHGLGADGYDFVPIAEELQLPETLGTKLVFPHARQRPVTINNGFVMRAWYDLRGFGPGSAEDEAGIRESEAIVRGHIDREVAAGITAENIVVAGFSQGGAMALHSGLRYPSRLGGILALSTYLPLRDSIAKEADEANRHTPIFMAHGSRDQVVPEIAGKLSHDLLEGLGYPVRWKSYAMEHQVCVDEIADIAAWLKERLRRNN
jgi:phospholipase/carboxylesterase